MSVRNLGQRSWQAIVGSAALGTACLAMAAPGAADYPSRPIQIVVPYTAGGSVDAVARTLALELTQRLGQSVVVENRVGAGSNIGSTYVARAAPDGHTLLLISPANAINVSLYKDMPYDMRTDMAPIAIVGRAPGILLVNPGFEADTLQEFVALAKARPGGLNFGSGGSGSSEHLSGELFKKVAGVDLVHVPYKGGAAAMADVLSGRVEAFFTNQANVIGQIKGGAVKVLAVASDTRSTILPDVPTFAEQGYPQQKVSVWWGLAAPSGTPEPVLDRLSEALLAAYESPELRERLQAMGAEPLRTTRTEASAFVQDEIRRWGEVVSASGAQVD